MEILLLLLGLFSVMESFRKHPERHLERETDVFYHPLPLHPKTEPRPLSFFWNYLFVHFGHVSDLKSIIIIVITIEVKLFIWCYYVYNYNLFVPLPLNPFRNVEKVLRFY